MTEELKGKIGLDTTDFRTAISTINREIRVVESGFRAAAAGLGDWASSADGLEMRIGALTDQIGLQQIKVEALLGEYTRVAAEKGKNSRAAQELEIRLNNEEAALSKLKNELGNNQQALDEMGSEANQAAGQVNELDTAQDGATDSASRLGSVMSGLGSAIGAGVAVIGALAAAAAAAAGAMAALVLSSAEMAGTLVDTSNQTGISVERLQELAFIGDQVGVSSETMTSSLARLTRSMSDVGDNKDVTETFSRLGVSTRFANGEMRDSETVMQETLAALAGVANETERDALAMEIFGRSAMELNPLIKTSADEMEAMRQQAHDVGAVVSTDTVNSLESFGDTLAALKAGLAGTGAEIAGALLPGFEAIAGAAEEYLGQFSDIVRNAGGDVGAMADGIGGLLGQIATDLAGSAPQMLQAGLGIVQGLIDAILQALPALIPAAVGIITSLVEFLVANLPLIIDAGVQLLLALVNGILPMLPMLIDAALQMIITLANGISQALPTLIPAIEEIIPQIYLVLLKNLPLLISAALQLIIALATGLIKAIPVLLPYIPQIVQAIFDAIVASLPVIIEAAVQLILALVQGIVSMFPTLVQTTGELIMVIVRAAQALNARLLEMGRAIVVGVYEGIKAMRDWFYNKVLNFFKDLVDLVYNVLGIQSPSKVFADMGENMALGLGVGFQGAFERIEKEIAGAVGGLGGMEVALAGAGAGQGGGGRMVNVTIQATVADGIDLEMLAMRVAERIQEI